MVFHAIYTGNYMKFRALSALSTTYCTIQEKGNNPETIFIFYYRYSACFVFIGPTKNHLKVCEIIQRFQGVARFSYSMHVHTPVLTGRYVLLARKVK